VPDLEAFTVTIKTRVLKKEKLIFTKVGLPNKQNAGCISLRITAVQYSVL
jgi:hypothetical protein